MKRGFQLLLLAGLAFYMSGCAVGNKHNYQSVVAQLDAANTYVIAIGTHDTRSYILNGDKAPNFVGLSRGGYGNTFDVTTLSDKPLSTAMSEAIKNSFAQKGYNARVVILNPHDDFNTAIAKLKQQNGVRLVYLKLTNWKSDTYTNTALIYDAHLMVMDSDGQVLAEHRVQGRDNLKGSVMNPPAHAKQAVPVAFAGKLEEMLNDPQVKAALD